MPELNIEETSRAACLEIVKEIHEHIRTLTVALSDGELSDEERKTLSEINRKIICEAQGLGLCLERYQR